MLERQGAVFVLHMDKGEHRFNRPAALTGRRLSAEDAVAAGIVAESRAEHDVLSRGVIAAHKALPYCEAYADTTAGWPERRR